MNKKLFARIAELTENNDHGTAYLVAAQELGQTKLVQEFSEINQQHRLAGELSMELYHKRFAAYTELMAYAKSHMSAAEYRKFYMLF